MNRYDETLRYLYEDLPVFQHNGPGAYKPGLDRVRAIAAALGNPERSLRCIHVGGTNGKGSTAHTIAAVLQSAGYRTGLFTSPHLVDFRERIRIDGVMISESEVVDFVDRYRAECPQLEPSFFELTTMMAFDHFARHQVDVAVIEVGLGGRLDSTNIITPMLSIITNISLDHTALLGSTHEAIAAEKAGIIKGGIPAVIGQADRPEVRRTFESRAAAVGAPIVFATDTPLYDSFERSDDAIVYHGSPWGDITGCLTGDCQPENALTVMHALLQLPLDITAETVAKGFAGVTELTGLMGRWMSIKSATVTTICDTGHNPGGWEHLGPRLQSMAQGPGRLLMVLGFVSDKDIASILPMMPKGDRVTYLWVQASVPRAMSCEALARRAAELGLDGTARGSVTEGYQVALNQAREGDTIFVGGSTFTVADLLASLRAN